MAAVDPAAIKVIACDIFGTTVDWHTGITEHLTKHLTAVAAAHGQQIEAAAFTDAWRARYRPSLERVNRGDRDWAGLDVLHRESLDELLDEHGIAGTFDDAARRRLTYAWHRLPAWDDARPGLTRLRGRYITAALSNGGFALLTHLVKAAALPFDCILSADLAQAYKPHPRAYLTAAELLDVAPSQILMVAAHQWDIDGARAAGLATAFLHRPHEKGPRHTADRAQDVTSDLSVTGYDHLADTLTR